MLAACECSGATCRAARIDPARYFPCMRVLVVTQNYPRFAGDPAGAFVARLAVAARTADHDVRILTPHAPGTAEHEVMGDLPVHRFRYAPEALERIGYTGSLHRRALSSPVAMAGVLFFLAAFRRALADEVRTFAPDIIHAHWWMPAGWLASRLGERLIVTCHGSDVRLLDRAPLRRIGRGVFHRASAITAVSRFLARDIARVFPDLRTPVEVTPMPVDVDRFAAGLAIPKAHPPRILFAGNLTASKGVDVLIEAFALLCQRGVSCQLRILGQGHMEGALRALAKRLGIDDGVLWSPLVPQDAMPAEYGASTVTVLPTRGNAEGLGLVLVEALLAGSAVVGTIAGGIPEVVRPECTGLLARPDDASDLAAQIERLLLDEALRNRLIRAGQAHMRATYASGPAAERFLDIYRHVDATGHVR